MLTTSNINKKVRLRLKEMLNNHTKTGSLSLGLSNRYNKYMPAAFASK